MSDLSRGENTGPTGPGEKKRYVNLPTKNRRPMPRSLPQSPPAKCRPKRQPILSLTQPPAPQRSD